MSDAAHQEHYEGQTIQPIEVLMADLTPAEFLGFLKGNLIKYTLRAGRKPGTDDTAKAHVYAGWLAEFTATGTIKQFDRIWHIPEMDDYGKLQDKGKKTLLPKMRR